MLFGTNAAPVILASSSVAPTILLPPQLLRHLIFVMYVINLFVLFIHLCDLFLIHVVLFVFMRLQYQLIFISVFSANIPFGYCQFVYGCQFKTYLLLLGSLYKPIFTGLQISVLIFYYYVNFVNFVITVKNCRS